MATTENNTLVSRRHFLRAGTAAVAISATAAPVAVAASHPDAELLALGRQWEESAAALDANRTAFDAAEERIEQIEILEPEELFQQPQDFSLGLIDAHTRHDGRRWYVYDRIDDLRTKPRMKQDWSQVTKGPKGEQFCAWVPDPKAQARADEIVAAYDRWQAALAKAEEDSGLAAAEAEHRRLETINSDLRERIALMPARTIEGLAVKARIYAWFLDGMDQIESEFERQVETNGPTDETIMLAMVRDLLRLNSPASITA